LIKKENLIQSTARDKSLRRPLGENQSYQENRGEGVLQRSKRKPAEKKTSHGVKKKKSVGKRDYKGRRVKGFYLLKGGRELIGGGNHGCSLK